MAGERKFVSYSVPVLMEYCFKKKNGSQYVLGELRLKEDKDSHEQYFAVLAVHAVEK